MRMHRGESGGHNLATDDNVMRIKTDRWMSQYWGREVKTKSRLLRSFLNFLLMFLFEGNT